MTAFLAMIRACEGTTGPDGYRALFGYPLPGRTFDDFASHPDRRYPFTQTDGHVNYSTAAGAYQIIWPTWVKLQAKMGLPDFTPQSQDEAAVELITEASALFEVEGGLLRSAIDKCSAVWASLPASTYPQPKRSFFFAQNAYLAAGGAQA
jgi:lysozyme